MVMGLRVLFLGVPPNVPGNWGLGTAHGQHLA